MADPTLIEKTCVECGSTFQVKRSQHASRFCSKACRKIVDRRNVAIRKGKLFEIDEIGRPHIGDRLTCEVCGKYFIGKMGVTCCSGDCRSQLRLVRKLREPQDEFSFLREVVGNKRTRKKRSDRS